MLIRHLMTEAPEPVPPAPLRGKEFELADGRTYVIPLPTLAQIHGPCLAALSTIVNVVQAEQWGVAVAVKELFEAIITTLHQAMSRNYQIEPRCEASRGIEGAPLCNRCCACLLDIQCAQPVLIWITEVSGYREILRLVGHTPATASLDNSGASTTIN